MSFRNAVIIVASPRPRVGKTLIARLATDFYVHNGRSVDAFDLNSGEGTLTQFLPDHAATAEIGDIKGQMALFDRLIADDDVPKVVDLGVPMFEAFFTLAQQIGFAEEARKRSIAPVILYVIAPDKLSVDGYAAVHQRLPQAALSLVHNEMLGSAQHRDKYPLTDRGSVLLHIPALAPGLRKFIERPPFSFADSRIASRMDVPMDVSFEMQRWLRRVFLEFRELELRVMLADLQSTIQVQS